MDFIDCPHKAARYLPANVVLVTSDGEVVHGEAGLGTTSLEPVRTAPVAAHNTLDRQPNNSDFRASNMSQWTSLGWKTDCQPS